jgi:photosystem II stability/assembly factor-like uncharacterized protein
VVERTTNQGRTWTPVAVPELITSNPPELLAPDASDAWLLVPSPDGIRVYVTDDAGTTWRRVDQNFTR